MLEFNSVEKAVFSCYTKAARDGEFLLPFPDQKASKNMRARAYSAVKTLRGKAKTDRDLAQLLEIVQEVSVHITEEGLLYRRKDRDPSIMLVMKALGEDLVSPVDVMAEKSLERVQAAVSAPEPAYKPASQLSERAASYLTSDAVKPISAPPMAKSDVPGDGLTPAQRATKSMPKQGSTFVYNTTPGAYPANPTPGRYDYTELRDLNLIPFENLRPEDQARPEAQGAKR